MTALHQAAQKAVEAPITDERIRQLFVEHGWSDPLPAKESLLYELCRAAAREGRESALQQQPEPVADKRRVAMETVYFRRSPSDQRQDSLTVPAGTATQHVREELIESIVSAADGIAASPSTTQQEAGSGWKLVPETITEKMHVAAVRTAMRCSGNDDFPRRVWRAMIAAAPSTPAREEAGVPAVDPTEALRKAEKALAFALEVVCSYEEGGECSESGEFIKANLADVRAALGLPAVDSQTNPPADGGA